MELHYTASTKAAFGLVLAILAIQFYRAVTLPIGAGEAYLYDRFVRPTTRQVLASELPDRDVLYSLLEKRSVGLFHVSPLSVRLPGLLFGVLFLAAVWRLARLGFGDSWKFPVAVFLATAISSRWFVRADGAGAALALLVCAVCLTLQTRYLNWIGICIGLSITAETDYALAAIALSLLILAFRARWWDWIDHVAIPAVVVVAVLLAIPASHAHAPRENVAPFMEREAAGVQSALEALRADAGMKPIRVATVPSIEPLVNFYRAQHRANNWRATRRDQSGHFDYYLLPVADSAPAGKLVYQDGEFVVVRASF